MFYLILHNLFEDPNFKNINEKNSQFTIVIGNQLIVYGVFLQESAVNGEHLWVDTNASGDFCYVGETECSVSWKYDSNFVFKESNG